MAIPEVNLTTFAEIGAQATSRDTYATISRVFDDANFGGSRDFDVFLQGSYGNDTNIFRESDVDVVIRLNSTYTFDDSGLTPQARLARAAQPWATYNHPDFQRDVFALLSARFGDDVQRGSKAITIEAYGNRRKTDVIVALEHRKYIAFGGLAGDMHTKGISFWKNDGTHIVNYPTQHRDNLREKNQRTSERFKHVVRIFKNLREWMLVRGQLIDGIAPSYYIEGMLYNVPDDRFVGTYAQMVEACLVWLRDADRLSFMCPNHQYALFNGDENVTWQTWKCDEFVARLINTWNNW